MAALNVVDIVPTGGAALALTAAAAGGDTIAEDGREHTFLMVTNGGGASINVTVAAAVTSVNVPNVGPITVPNVVTAVANGTTKFIGPFSAAYRNAANNVAITYSAVTSVTVGAFRLNTVGM